MSLTRSFTLSIGIAFVLAGIGGFIPILTTQADATAPALTLNLNYGYLLGMFPVNFLHNLFHLVAGLAALWAVSDEGLARRYCQIIGVILTLFTIMGSLPALSTALGLMPLFGHDVWLHGLEATVALYLGFYIKKDYKFKRMKR